MHVALNQHTPPKKIQQSKVLVLKGLVKKESISMYPIFDRINNIYK